MVSHVRTVAILMIVNGSLQLLLGVMFVGMVVFMAIVTLRDKAEDPPPAERLSLAVMVVFYVGLGLVLLLAGVLNIRAGRRARAFRNRRFVLVALFGNAAVAPTFYCAPTSLGLLIYGVLVFYNAEVVRAFELGDQGVPAAEIEKRFPRRPRVRSWGDEDDES
jgi:hypothetical protein